MSKQHVCPAAAGRPIIGFGSAIHTIEQNPDCRIDGVPIDPNLWFVLANDGEYGTAVSFCPFCGARLSSPAGPIRRVRDLVAALSNFDQDAPVVGTWETVLREIFVYAAKDGTILLDVDEESYRERFERGDFAGGLGKWRDA